MVKLVSFITLRWGGERHGQESVSAGGLRGTWELSSASLPGAGHLTGLRLTTSTFGANGLFVLFPGEFQPLGKGPPLACLSRCHRDSPAGLWGRLGLFHLIAGGCVGFRPPAPHRASSRLSDTQTVVRMCSSSSWAIYVLTKEKLENTSFLTQE